MATLNELVTSDNEVAITISFVEFYVEVSRDSVTFYDGSKDREEGMLATLSRDNFDDIITACELMPAND